tara:strand:- start:210 stop:410 length:201 start_codon:yes stop_codon:yes gene_type:complete
MFNALNFLWLFEKRMQFNELLTKSKRVSYLILTSQYLIIKKYHKDGFNECYPLEMLDTLMGELDPG